MKKIILSAIAMACIAQVQAADGFEFSGYSRGGAVLSYDKDNNVKGGLSLGGDLQKYRLGNEGDYGIEIDLIKNFVVNGIKYKVHYMPSKWKDGELSTNQAFVEMSGLSFAPEAKFWAGQRRLRIQDVHIVDKFLMDYGDTQGAGVTGVNLGAVKLGVGVFTGDTFDKQMVKGTSAKKLNVDVSDIQVNEGGKLRVLLTQVSAAGLAGGNSGSALAVSHTQSNLGMAGMTNTLFLQTSKGHAEVGGKFQDLGGVGKKVTRIADTINWQSGPLGGQAVVGMQTNQDEGSSVKRTDSSLGGRISYALNQNFKLLAEAGVTSSTFSDNSPKQTLNKITIAPTLAVGGDFWSRPELRFYVTRASWNKAAAKANSATFGMNGKTSQTLAGVQYEIWW
ncbi:carbohydrate porin [Limnohabitans sp.]|jgi:maltoporin|uniref:carbohydrate porin n=1 Tax=Limnohabitans sp. TaxID=1907725 RepID=UPI0037C0D40F